MRRANKVLKLILVLVTCILIVSFISSKFIIIRSNSNAKEVILGIIDGQLSMDYDNILTNNVKAIDSDKKTHGDQLIIFANKYYPNLKIYYYDASNENGSVDTDGIITGLEWMKEKGIRNVNISMSSYNYLDELQNYIEKNQNELKIFASYHNLEQTLDYPAMYNYVVASGKKSRITFKSNDIEYKSNTIVLISKGIEKYRGNSFLSIITTINDIIDN